MISIFNLIGGFGGSPDNIYPDDAPTFTSPETLVAADASVAGILFTSDLNGANHIILSGNWVDAIQLNAISPHEFYLAMDADIDRTDTSSKRTRIQNP